MEHKKRKPLLIAGFALLLIAVFIISTVLTTVIMNQNRTDTAENKGKTETSGKTNGRKDVLTEAEKTETAAVQTFSRPGLLRGETIQLYDENLVPSVPYYQVEPDFSNLINPHDVKHRDEAFAEKLRQNGFVVEGNYGSLEFFSVYENNRYSFVPSFVTVDSMMHTYHLYFQHLQKNTERSYLMPRLQALSATMLAESMRQYEALKGSDWEEAALRNAGFFAVANRLLETGEQIPEECRGLVEEEVSLIMRAADMTASPIFSGDSAVMEDYTQYKPRGYYGGDPLLERYFRTMMWYGRMTFPQADEDLTRSALLNTIAMDQAMDVWQSVYAVTSFFVGESDDAGYYEYKPLAVAAYGDGISAEAAAADREGWERFYRLTKELEPPKINSIPLEDVGPDTDVADAVKGFRFMGQRFTFDAAVFQALIYNRVGENSHGENRLLPNALDIPAAFGSEAAYEILRESGETDYRNYDAQMGEVRDALENAPDTLWTSSLYAGWLKTLLPLLEEKGEGYPAFMQSGEWAKRNVECFLGSWTELKHDTVLYGKPSMAEMGGGPIDEVDDRGYVEPEPVVFGRLASLIQKTREGLKQYDMLSASDEENLNRLYELARSLMTIAEKELRNETLTDDEYELIRIFGGELEHFWYDVWKDEAPYEYFSTEDFPAPLITDVATDAENGRVLQVATGRASQIWVIVPVDGTLRAARGCVYNFYQFTNPAGDRMTDNDWYVELGLLPAEGEEWPMARDVTAYQPEWVKSFRYYYSY